MAVCTGQLHHVHACLTLFGHASAAAERYLMQGSPASERLEAFRADLTEAKRLYGILHSLRDEEDTNYAARLDGLMSGRMGTFGLALTAAMSHVLGNNSLSLEAPEIIFREYKLEKAALPPEDLQAIAVIAQ